MLGLRMQTILAMAVASQAQTGDCSKRMDELPRDSDAGLELPYCSIRRPLQDFYW